MQHPLSRSLVVLVAIHLFLHVSGRPTQLIFTPQDDDDTTSPHEIFGLGAGAAVVVLLVATCAILIAIYRIWIHCIRPYFRPRPASPPPSLQYRRRGGRYRFWWRRSTEGRDCGGLGHQEGDGEGASVGHDGGAQVGTGGTNNQNGQELADMSGHERGTGDGNGARAAIDPTALAVHIANCERAVAALRAMQLATRQAGSAGNEAINESEPVPEQARAPEVGNIVGKTRKTDRLSQLAAIPQLKPTNREQLDVEGRGRDDYDHDILQGSVEAFREAIRLREAEAQKKRESTGASVVDDLQRSGSAKEVAKGGAGHQNFSVPSSVRGREIGLQRIRGKRDKSQDSGQAEMF